MADNRIAYGLAKKYGIDTTGMSPKEVWYALSKKGVKELGGHGTDENVYKSADELKEQQQKELPDKEYEVKQPTDGAKDSGIEDDLKLAVGGQEARNLYKEIKSGKRLSYEELLENPVIKEFEKKAQKAQQLAEKKPPMSDKEKAQYGEKFLKGANSTPKQYRAMGMQKAKAIETIKSVGLSCFDWTGYYGKVYGLVVCGMTAGQGNCRSAMAEAFHNSLIRQGIASGMYYQMD